MSNPRPLVDERGLAATYDGGAYVDAWEAVEQYRKATSYAFRKGVKSSATARALDLPRGRLRTWIDDGGQPDAIRGIEVAREHGWLDVEYDDLEFTALNMLVANVFSGGSIAEQHYQPSFALNHLDHKSHVVDALEAAGVEYDFYHEEDEDRSTQVRPTDRTRNGAWPCSKRSRCSSRPETRTSEPAVVRVSR
ncbi:hypothetical protein [Natrarchaeobaculum sulfurireducens]|uniref:Uncharacterized protein n=1 Tax=Natrarchaeobaculum sulfurireducens TaxID=2044521 RepID=A0A346PI83_9EURY|nr:hypothetical protein AArc1_2919 [Natrarchaeobaculum sulfurireducens]